jgi:hypothetical protein
VYVAGRCGGIIIASAQASLFVIRLTHLPDAEAFIKHAGAGKQLPHQQTERVNICGLQASQQLRQARSREAWSGGGTHHQGRTIFSPAVKSPSSLLVGKDISSCSAIQLQPAEIPNK